MFSAIHVLNKKRGDPEPSSTGVAGGSEIPLNNLDSDPPPSMPGLDPVSSGTSSGKSPAGITTGGSSGPADPPLNFDVPQDSDPVDRPAEKAPQMPVVWVTEVGAKAYTQPGFNMPIARELEQWEELLILETNKENWDRVQDLKGQQFWVQSKIVTIIRPQNLSQPSVAEKKVMDFYTQVAHKEHSDAYVHLSPEWKRELSFDKFVKGYDHVDSLRSEIVNVLELGEDRFQVDVAMQAIEEGATIDYLGIYTVEKVEDKWYLTSGSLNKQAGQGGDV